MSMHSTRALARTCSEHVLAEADTARTRRRSAYGDEKNLRRRDLGSYGGNVRKNRGREEAHREGRGVVGLTKMARRRTKTTAPGAGRR